MPTDCLREATATLTCLALAVVGLSKSPACAQSPECLIDTPAPYKSRYLWGGELRQVFDRVVGVGEGQEHRVWTAEDGGRIRYSRDGGATWKFASTPDESNPTSAALDGVSQNILDVYFLEDGQTGWACGVGGRLLKSTDGGATWAHLDPLTTSFPNDQAQAKPAVLWRVRFLNEQVGYVAGLWTLSRTSDGGQSWESVELYDAQDPSTPGISQYPSLKFEFYSLDLIDTGGGDFIVNVAGQFWTSGEDSCEANTMLFHADSSLPESCKDPLQCTPGTRLWRTFDAEDYAVGANPFRIKDPWDIEFEPTPTATGYRGYLVGGGIVPTCDSSCDPLCQVCGASSTSQGAIFVSEDSGATWTPEAGGNLAVTPSTIYGVAAQSGGYAVTAGYAGQIWVRRPGGTWFAASPPGFTAPISGAHGSVPGTCWTVGTWGFLRKATDVLTLQPTWQTQNPPYMATSTCPAIVEPLWRLTDVHFKDATAGLVLGQFQLIAKTDPACSNGSGCRWEVVHGGVGSGAGSEYLAALAFSDTHPNRGLAVGASAPNADSMLYTPNFGDTWIPAGPAATSFFDVDDAGSGVLMALGREGAMASCCESSPPGEWVLQAMNVGGHQIGLAPPTIRISIDWSGVAREPDFLVALEFLTPRFGVVVGEDRCDGNAAAYSLCIMGNVAVATDLMTSLRPGRLLDVKGLGSDPTTATLLAVGFDRNSVADEGLVMRFDGVGMIEDLQAMGAGALTTRYSKIDMVGTGPVASTILIGSTAITDEDASLSSGLNLLYDATAGGTGWSVCRSLTNKGTAGICLIDDDHGYLTTSGALNADGEFGMQGESGLIYFDPSR